MINVQRSDGRTIIDNERPQDLHAFSRFVDQQLAGDPIPTIGEVIGRWDSENQPNEEQADTVHAVKKSLADIEAGESGIPDREAVAELRKKYGLSDALTLQSDPEEWVKRLQAFVDSQPVRTNAMDDSRESIYAGRGE
jgi:hypothetical protein